MFIQFTQEQCSQELCIFVVRMYTGMLVYITSTIQQVILIILVYGTFGMYLQCIIIVQ